MTLKCAVNDSELKHSGFHNISADFPLAFLILPGMQKTMLAGTGGERVTNEVPFLPCFKRSAEYAADSSFSPCLSSCRLQFSVVSFWHLVVGILSNPTQSAWRCWAWFLTSRASVWLGFCSSAALVMMHWRKAIGSDRFFLCANPPSS
jgi:hypothetical protein